MNDEQTGLKDNKEKVILPPPEMVDSDLNSETTNNSHERAAPLEPPAVIKIADLQRMGSEALAQYARNLNLRNLSNLTKSQIVFEIVKWKSDHTQDLLVAEGVLEVLPDGFGFLRSPNYNYVSSAEDIYVSPAQIRRFDLKKGDHIQGTIRAPKEKRNFLPCKKLTGSMSAHRITSKIGSLLTF